MSIISSGLVVLNSTVEEKGGKKGGREEGREETRKGKGGRKKS